MHVSSRGRRRFIGSPLRVMLPSRLWGANEDFPAAEWLRLAPRSPLMMVSKLSKEGGAAVCLSVCLFAPTTRGWSVKAYVVPERPEWRSWVDHAEGGRPWY